MTLFTCLYISISLLILELMLLIPFLHICVHIYDRYDRAYVLIIVRNGFYLIGIGTLIYTYSDFFLKV